MQHDRKQNVDILYKMDNGQNCNKEHRTHHCITTNPTLPLWKKPKHIATNFGATIHTPMRLTSAEYICTTHLRTGL